MVCADCAQVFGLGCVRFGMRIRTFIASAALGLALAPAAQADTATQTLNIARDACGGTTPANPHLSLGLGVFTSGCGSLVGILGGSATDYSTSAGDGVPVTLDTARPIHVAVTVASDPGVVLGGIGDEVVDFSLSGKRGTKAVSLGDGSATTTADVMLRQTGHVYEFDLPLTAALAGTYSNLTLTLSVGGSQQSGYIDYGGGSYIELPVFDDSVPAE
jgi:hypothetical protein